MNFKAMRYESIVLNRIVANKSQVYPGFTKHTTQVFLISNMNWTPILFRLPFKSIQNVWWDKKAIFGQLLHHRKCAVKGTENIVLLSIQAIRWLHKHIWLVNKTINYWSNQFEETKHILHGCGSQQLVLRVAGRNSLTKRFLREMTVWKCHVSHSSTTENIKIGWYLDRIW